MAGHADHARSQNSLRPWMLLLLVLALLPLVLRGMDALYAYTTDLGHHYALTARLYQDWSLAPGIDRSLGEMNIYPRGSHQLAALLGKLLGSPLAGMQLLAGLSIALIWATLSAVLLALPLRARWCCALLLAALALANRASLQLFVHASEISGYYFYAQLVGHAGALLVLLAALLLERRGARAWCRHLFIIAGIAVVALVHLLPASELLGLLGASLLFDLCQRRPTLRQLGASAALAVLGALVFIKHPSYIAMKEIAANNGVLDLVYIPNMKSMAVLALAVLVLAALLAWRWRSLAHTAPAQGRQALGLKYLALYGVAVSGMCVLQLIALQLGQGSEYAVKKHIFALDTALLLLLALLPMLRHWNSAPHASRSERAAAQLLLLPALAALCCYAVQPQGPKRDASDLVQLEHQLTLRRDLLLADTPARNVYVLQMTHSDTYLDYMYSLGIFRTSREAAFEMLAPLGEAKLDGVVLTGQNSTLSKLSQCALPGSSKAFPMLEARCVTRELVAAQPVIELGSLALPPPCTLRGFSFAEPSGRWSEQASASIQCPLPQLNGQRPRSLTLHASAFVQQDRRQRVQLRVNGGAVQEFVFDAAHAQQQLTLPLAADQRSEVELSFTLPDAKSPHTLGLGEDQRLLGMMLAKLEFR
ncbi:DUF7024 domain-containing protein [Pseudoduganella danionis]|uniref:DUF7024 domain-containing protein n=1 Tax=Pseudoduganella danionis TaxID=1890295 RepID=A0ABW9SIP8_9BURK|nr:hypothetical protein [Pseudoduganella danionis]MTW31665.1 hypothetical protein [Pseudoduganella danionis]